MKASPDHLVPLLTLTALVFLLTSVKSHVLLQVGFLSEGLPTECAEPGLGENCVFADFVIPQSGGGEVGLIALVTLVAPCPRVIGLQELLGS